MSRRIGPTLAVLSGVVTAATTVWVAASIAGGASPTDRATLGQFVLALVALATTTWATRQAFSSRNESAVDRVARLTVELGDRAGCRRLQDFLRTHDSHVVYVEMSCPDYILKAFSVPDDRWSFCVPITNWSTESPNALKVWTRVNAGEGFPLGDLVKARDVMQIVVPNLPSGSTVSVASNGRDMSSGAGGITIKGYFYVGIGGTGTLGPPGVTVATLAPVLPLVG